MYGLKLSNQIYCKYFIHFFVYIFVHKNKKNIMVFMCNGDDDTDVGILGSKGQRKFEIILISAELYVSFG